MRIPDLKRAIARVTSGETRGTGFLVSPKGLVLTCAHVIDPEAPIQLKLADEQGLFQLDFVAKEIDRHGMEEGDFSLLQIEGPLPAHSLSLDLIESRQSKGNEFETFGFPEMAATHGITLQGFIVDTDNRDPYGNPRLVLDHANAITHGVSGAPVFDRWLGGVIGVISRVARPDKLQRGLNIAAGIPADFIASYSEQLSLRETTQAKKAQAAIRTLQSQQTKLQALQGKLALKGKARKRLEQRLADLQRTWQDLADILLHLEKNYSLLDPLTQHLARRQLQVQIAAKSAELENLEDKMNALEVHLEI